MITVCNVLIGHPVKTFDYYYYCFCTVSFFISSFDDSY